MTAYRGWSAWWAAAWVMELAIGCATARGQEAPSAGPQAAPKVGEAAVTIMSFNIRYGTARDGDDAWPRRRELVIDRIRAHDPDVIGLQEALRFQIDELLAAFPAYSSLGVGRDDGKDAGEHAAVLYRKARLKPAAPKSDSPPQAAATVRPHGDFWFSDTPTKPGSKSWGNSITRICTWARFEDAATSRPFYVFNVHLDHQSQPSRERSAVLLAERIAARAAPDPVIITGDFNAGEDNAAMRYLLGKAESVPALKDSPKPDQPSPALRDSFRVVHPNAPDVGTFNAFKGVVDGDKIDFVLIDDGWEVVAAEIDRTMPEGRCPSDHFPVVAMLRPKQQEVPAK